MTAQPLNPDWIAQFDQHLKAMFAIDHVDAGLDEAGLARYSDLEPRDAALEFANDYDLDRVDQGWGA